MRRSALVPVIAGAALLLLAPAVAAVGPGGWDHVGVGATTSTPSLNGPVYAMNADAPGVLVVGGGFTGAGGISGADRVATWNGSAWGALAGNPIDNGAVFALAYYDGKVYAGGTFTNAGGNSDADFLAVWNGAGWGPFCNSAGGAAFGGSVKALQVIGSTLYVGGSFQDGAGIAAADYLLACDLGTGASTAVVPTDGDINGGIYALTADSNGTLYAGGQFIDIADIPAADHVAAYDGSWHAMGSGSGPGGAAVDGYVRALAASGTDVYVGTDSVNIAGIVTADHVARWNGSTWSPLGTSTAGTDGWLPAGAFVNALAVSGSLVFAAGSFQNANGVAAADHIASFDGSSWRPIGSDGSGNGPMGSALNALGVFRSKVYAAGSFTSAGGDVRAQYLAAYALKLPDAAIAVASAGPYTGNAVYSATAAGETRTRTVRPRHSGTFYVRIQNDGLVAASFTIKGTGGARGITVRYYRGTTGITSAVKAGTYSTGAIAARASITIRVVVSVASSSASSSSFLVKATSVAGTPADAVKATVKRG
jgi:hypothetical protein